MGRRRESSLLDDVFSLLKLAPIWVGPVLAATIFLFLRFVTPLFFPAPQDGIDTGIIWRKFMPLVAWLFAGAIIVVWIAAEVHKLFDRRLLDSQAGKSSIRSLPWREFERLVCEAYRRKVYLAEVVGTASGDGGVDIELTGRGGTIIIQCKQWRAFTVGVTTVRELLGVVVSRRRRIATASSCRAFATRSICPTPRRQPPVGLRLLQSGEAITRNCGAASVRI